MPAKTQATLPEHWRSDSPAEVRTPKKQLSLQDAAVEILKQSGTPLLLQVVVDKMKSQGYVFKSCDPAGSLGVSLCSSGKATIVEKIGGKGLWMVKGAPHTVNQQEVSKEKRADMLRELNNKIKEKESQNE